MRKALIVAVMLALAGCGFTTIDPGERGAFTTWGVMEQKSYAPGFYWYNPFSTHVDHVSVQVQAFEMKKMGAATRDLQEVHANVTVNYTLDGDNVHRVMSEIGREYREKILAPALQDALKAGTAHFALAEIIQNRAKLREEVTKALQARVSTFYIKIADNGVNLTNFDVSPEYMHAVEAKQIEQQKAEQAAFLVQGAQRQAEVAAANAKGKADAVREEAKGDADALRTKGQAQAEYNEKVSRSLSPMLIQKQWIDAWAAGAQVPTVLSEGKGMFLQLPLPQARYSEEKKEN